MKYSKVHRVVYHSENLPIKYHEQRFCITIIFSGQHWTGKSIEKMGKISVFGEFSKNVNFFTKFSFNTENSTIYDLLFLAARYPPKNDNKHLSEMKN